MIQQTGNMNLKNRIADLFELPEAAQQELMAFCEFLLFKYQGHTDTEQSNKQRVLSKIFQEANGILPESYSFDREELHER